MITITNQESRNKEKLGQVDQSGNFNDPLDLKGRRSKRV